MNLSFQDTSEFSDEVIGELAAKVVAIDPWLRLGFTQGELHYRTSHPECGSRHLVIVDDGKPAGLICLKHPWLYGVYIGLFAILPEAQGKGVGSSALEFIEREYRDKVKNIWLLVSDFNEQAKAFYQSRGFKTIGTIDDFLVEGEDEVLMRKVL